MSDTIIAGKNFENMKLCFSCRHWKGDKQRVRDDIKKFGDIVMDTEQGWPQEGDCDKKTEWLSISVNGNASASVSIQANFGCRYHEEEK
jgi:hypothetical protein